MCDALIPQRLQEGVSVYILKCLISFREANLNVLTDAIFQPSDSTCRSPCSAHLPDAFSQTYGLPVNQLNKPSLDFCMLFKTPSLQVPSCPASTSAASSQRLQVSEQPGRGPGLVTHKDCCPVPSSHEHQLPPGPDTQHFSPSQHFTVPPPFKSKMAQKDRS